MDFTWFDRFQGQLEPDKDIDTAIEVAYKLVEQLAKRMPADIQGRRPTPQEAMLAAIGEETAAYIQRVMEHRTRTAINRMILSDFPQAPKIARATPQDLKVRDILRKD